MSSRTGLLLEYLPLAELDPARWSGVMGVATFDAAHSEIRAAPIPVAEVSTPVLGACLSNDRRSEVDRGSTAVGEHYSDRLPGKGGALCEVWRTRQAVESGSRGRVRYARASNMVFGCIAVPETQGLSESQPPLYCATEEAYREILGTLDALGYPHLIRVWNYVPEINRDTHGVERYRQFNSARQAALLAGGRPVTGNVSAACALGATVGSPLVVYFLASHTAPTCIENPRQVSAYNYPPQYGIRSPVFSRAAVHHDSDSMTLFISGTASIVGHQTVHAGDPGAQTRETLANIQALLEEANRVTGTDEFTLDALAYKVYVRHPADLPVIQAELQGSLGSLARLVYLHADICRRDLAVEIEATAMIPVGARA